MFTLVVNSEKGEPGQELLLRNNLGWCGGDMGMPTLQNIQYILKIKKNIFSEKISVYSVYKKTENLCPFFSWSYYSLLQNHTYSSGKHLKKIIEIILKGAGLLAILKELIIILPI